jgi:tRNA(Ile)-lysidine synthase
VTRSHPPALLTHARRALKSECALESGSRLLVAVSGGPDSMALLHVLAKLRAEFSLALFAHGVDHGLRPEAPAELALANELAAALGVPFTSTKVALANGANLQARAREARYSALEERARSLGGALIATAHHADDRAETVLIRLLRGGAPGALAVLPARDGARLRPLIRARRADVLLHLERHGVNFANDPSNHDARFLRSRVRHELLPLLVQLSPKIVDHLTALADELAADPLQTDSFGVQNLGRAQRNQLLDLLARKSTRGRVRLRGGRELRFDPRSGSVEIEGTETGTERAPYRR